MAVIIVGDGSFKQSGPPQWQRSIYDLDTLRVPYRGSFDNLSAFLDSLEEFQASEIDPNMFLQDFFPDNHPQFPTVTLVYGGRKEGVLPSGKHIDGDSVMSSTSSSSGLIGSPILSSPVSVQYYARRHSIQWLSKEEGVLGPSGDVTSPGGDPTSNVGQLAFTIGLYSPGSGYTVGQVISGGNSCINFSIRVTHLGVSNSILGYDVLSVNVCNPASIANPYIVGLAGFNVIPYTQFPVGSVGVRIISLVWAEAEFVSSGAALLANLLNTYFHPVIIQSLESEEMIPGQYWRNRKTKTRVLQPGSIAFAEPPGGIII